MQHIFINIYKNTHTHSHTERHTRTHIQFSTYYFKVSIVLVTWVFIWGGGFVFGSFFVCVGSSPFLENVLLKTATAATRNKNRVNTHIIQQTTITTEKKWNQYNTI